MSFGKTVKYYRKKKGLSQTELGELIGKSTRTICAYENEDTRPRIRETYQKLSDALDVNVNYLLVDDLITLKPEDRAGLDQEIFGVRDAVDVLENLFRDPTYPEEFKEEILNEIVEKYYKAKLSEK